MDLLYKYLLYILFFFLPILVRAQDEVKLRYYKAIELSNNGDHYAAIDELNQLIFSYPDFSMAYAQRARIRLILHQYDLATADYNKAIEMNSEYPNRYSRLAPLKSLSETYKGFIYKYYRNDIQNYKRTNSSVDNETLNNRLDFKSFDTLDYLDKAFIKYTNGDLEGAEKDIAIALSTDSSNSYAYYLSGAISEVKSEYAEALKQFDKVLMIDSTFYLPYYRKALLYKKLNQPASALSYLNKAEQLIRFSDLIYYNRAVLYIQLQQWDKALQDLNKTIEINPKFSEAWFNRGYVKKQLSDYEGSKSDYNEAGKINPGDYMVFNNRANLWMIYGEYSFAADDYNLAIKLNPDYVSGYFNRGICHVMKGNREAACMDFEKAVLLGYEKGSKKQ